MSEDEKMQMLRVAVLKHEETMRKYDHKRLRNYGELLDVQTSQNELLDALVNAVVV